MSKLLFVLLRCQDCCYFESDDDDPDHSGKCLRNNTWCDPFSRKCAEFITLDEHVTRIVPHVKTIRLTRQQAFDRLVRKD